MKNKYFILAFILMAAGLLFTACDNSDNAKDDVEEANQVMVNEQVQFEKEWQQFKIDSELKIKNNQDKIDEFKEAMKSTSTKFRAKYENQVLTLEQKNIELKKRINEFKYERKESWDSFKKYFNHEMDTVEAALKDIFTKKD